MLRAISPFPTVFSKDLYCMHVKQGLVWENVNDIAVEGAEQDKTACRLMLLLSLKNTRIIIISSRIRLNSLPNHKILDSSKLKEFADDNFKFEENSRKLSKRVENTVGKGEIAHNEQFLLFPQCFQKACFPGALKGVIEWE